MQKMCFSCGEKKPTVAKYHVPKYGYDLCEFHADMALIVGWGIEPIIEPSNTASTRLETGAAKSESLSTFAVSSG